MIAVDNPPRPGPSAAVDTLLHTLEDEHGALVELLAGLTDQLDALRGRETARIETATDAAATAVARLDGLRQARGRQMRLVGRLLGTDQVAAVEPLAAALDIPDPARAEGLRDVRGRVRHLAQQAQDRCAELEIALGVAVQLGRDLLQACRQPGPGSARVYTPAGAASAPASALLDRTG